MRIYEKIFLVSSFFGLIGILAVFSKFPIELLLISLALFSFTIVSIGLKPLVMRYKEESPSFGNKLETLESVLILLIFLVLCVVSALYVIELLLFIVGQQFWLTVFVISLLCSFFGVVIIRLIAKKHVQNREKHTGEPL